MDPRSRERRRQSVASTDNHHGSVEFRRQPAQNATEKSAGGTYTTSTERDRQRVREEYLYRWSNSRRVALRSDGTRAAGSGSYAMPGRPPPSRASAAEAERAFQQVSHA